MPDIVTVAEIPTSWHSTTARLVSVPAIEAWHDTGGDFDIGELDDQGIDFIEIDDAFADTAWCLVNLYDGEVVTGDTGTTTPVVTHRITGNVCAESIPIVATIYAINTTSGKCYSGVSDAQGDYTIDITDNDTGTFVLVRAQDFGQPWPANGALNVGDIVHPVASQNGYVFRVIIAGTTAPSEPVWNTTANTTSGGVTFTPVLLYRPAGGGFIEAVPI